MNDMNDKLIKQYENETGLVKPSRNDMNSFARFYAWHTGYMKWLESKAINTCTPLKIQQVWYDGKCKKCGGWVYETGCRDEDHEAAKYADYKNACSNEKCSENHWHYVGDIEFLDYYEHDTSDIGQVAKEYILFKSSVFYRMLAWFGK